MTKADNETTADRRTRLLQWLARSSPVLETRIAGKGLSRTLDELLTNGLASTGVHPKIKETVNDFGEAKATAISITDFGRRTLAGKVSPGP